MYSLRGTRCQEEIGQSEPGWDVQRGKTSRGSNCALAQGKGVELGDDTRTRSETKGDDDEVKVLG